MKFLRTLYLKKLCVAKDLSFLIKPVVDHFSWLIWTNVIDLGHQRLSLAWFIFTGEEWRNLENVLIDILLMKCWSLTQFQENCIYPGEKPDQVFSIFSSKVRHFSGSKGPGMMCSHIPESCSLIWKTGSVLLSGLAADFIVTASTSISGCSDGPNIVTLTCYNSFEGN